MTVYEHEILLKKALKYCRLRLLPFNELGYEETCEYGLRRSNLHNSISSIVDADRELVEKVFTKCASKFEVGTIDGIVVDGTSKNWSSDFPKIYDSFCKELDRIAELSDEERHPDMLTEEKLNEMDFDGLKEIPNLKN